MQFLWVRNSGVAWLCGLGSKVTHKVTVPINVGSGLQSSEILTGEETRIQDGSLTCPASWCWLWTRGLSSSPCGPLPPTQAV